jgi:osmotically-inducible protein OsmY
MGMIRRTAIVAAAGAATMYFLDPERGRARRAKARNRVERLTSTRAPVSTSYNDPTLAQKVASELFAGRDIPSDRVVINSEYGVITLRGEVDTPEQIRELEAAAARIPGVRGVQTMLHLPNTPPPNKAESIRAS